MGGGRGRRKFGNVQEEKTVRLMDQITKFEDFQAEVLPKLQKMLKEGKKPSEIFEWARSYAAARMVTEAISNPDAGKALTAAKDILDRADGKAKERVEHEHKFSKLKEEELDALLLSEAESLATDDHTEH